MEAAAAKSDATLKTRIIEIPVLYKTPGRTRR
jgi:allophanate hydrolase subunit 1